MPIVYLIQFDVTHEPESGTWTISHEADLGEHSGWWLTDRVPQFEAWKTSCRCLLAVADEFAATIAADLDRLVADVQARCSCRPCRRAVKLRLEKAFVAAVERPLLVYEPEQCAFVPFLPGGDLLSADDVALIAEARERRRQPDGQREHLLAAISEEISRIGQDLGLSGRPGSPGAERLASYASARKRYMETGTILDKEAMLACVTDADPDLEALGRDWDPAPEKPPRRQVGPVLALALVLIGVALTAASVVVLGNIMAVTDAGLAMAWGGAVLFLVSRPQGFSRERAERPGQPGNRGW